MEFLEGGKDIKFMSGTHTVNSDLRANTWLLKFKRRLVRHTRAQMAGDLANRKLLKKGFKEKEAEIE